LGWWILVDGALSFSQHTYMSWDAKQIEGFLQNIPPEPGVYLMKDKGGKVIYIGKAIHLYNRVSNYFQESGDPRPFVKLLSGILDRIDTVVTSNEKEALILENELIKRHRPRFNVLLKDDKNYLYLRLDPKARWPRLELVRRRKDDDAEYFGPYHSAFAARQTFALINRHFGLRSCSDTMLKNRSRPCLEYSMGRCPAPCLELISTADYEQRVQAALLFLKGRHDDVRRMLTKQMNLAADNENFEEAARLRDRLKAIESAMIKQAVILPTTQDLDAIGFARAGDCAAFAVLRFEKGVLVERVPYILDGVVAPEEDLLESLAFQYYGRAPIPAQVLLPPGQLERTAPLEEVLGARSQRVVKVIRPYRGPNADAIRMAIHNAELLLAEGLGSRKTRDRALARVAELLGLSSLPRRIETYDMSQFQSAEPVGAMVVFINGQPEKKAWRTYGIRLEEGPGDVGFMREVLKRRFANLRDNPEDMPDLIVLDGGESQLSVGISVMAEAGLSIPMVALAKARVIDHGFGPSKKIPERLYVQDMVAGVADSAGFRQIVPQAHDAGLHLLMRMRDEAHRFVVKFHRKRRFKKGTGSILDGIAGLGPKRRVMLLRHFRTVGNIKSASLEELNEVLPMGVAKAVFDKIHGTE
jgi:excinuclease ABC subunit C